VAAHALWPIRREGSSVFRRRRRRIVNERAAFANNAG